VRLSASELSIGRRNHPIGSGLDLALTVDGPSIRRGAGELL
jgi:hypothetical protein